MSDFVHLHLHTQYSLLDGAADISAVTNLAAELGMEAIAITDHGCMHGVVEFYEAAIKKGIKPIIGCEVYTAPRSRFSKDPSADKRYGHLVLLCKNEIGYRNLMALVTLANTEGFYYKPRVDMEILKKYSEGLIALSGCMRGDVAQAILNSGYDSARKKALEYIDIFSKENFFFEIQNHNLPEEAKIREELKKLSEELGIGLVATNDVHYVKKEDALLQDVLTCIQTGKRLSDTDRMKMNGDYYYFKSCEEMRNLFADYPGAIENTVKIAEMCNLEIDMNTMHLPGITIDGESSHEDYLKKLCGEGLLKRYENIDVELENRLNYELEIINNMGYTDYFLIVYDFIKFAKDSGISVGPGRGSAAGSLVAYCLDITEIDPISHNLLFERFLNPERVSMPDIDIDFCYKRRDEVREYVANKYGKTHVAQIVTFGTLAARAAIKDVGRVMGVDYTVTNTVSKAVPRVLNIKLKTAIEESPELSAMYNSNPTVKSMLDIAMKLEGFPRNCSTHAAGVVIGDDELTNYVPLQEGDGGLLTQYPMAALEKIGLLKMDFLGLRNLTIIDDAVELINREHSINIDIKNIDLNDKKTFELIQKGDTDGLFQLENPGLQTFLRKFKPNSVEDIITTTSIYRPGPMDQIPQFLENVKNPGKIVYKHPLLKEILEPTYGVVIYQEQVMKIVRTLAGYSLGRADLVRRVMAKKKYAEMLKEREIFLHGLYENGKMIVEGALRRGIDEKCANEIFDSLIDFANYAFNKSHAACYALVAYRTAYLKAHYPTCYLSAVLKNYAGYINKAVKYIASFSKYGIKVLPPDINKSYTHFSSEGNNVRFGFCWLKNVGDRFPNQIVYERKKNGVFKSFDDFIKRMSEYDITKRSIEVMIKCGCFDSVHSNRRVLIFNYERIIDRHLSVSRNAGIGQIDWFSDLDKEDDICVLVNEDSPDFSTDDKLRFEYEYAGMYFSGHPLDKWRFKVEAFSECSAAQICETPESDGKRVNICGRISSLSSRRSKSGKTIVSFNLEDFSGEIKVIAFDNTVSKFRDYLKDGSIVIISANISFADDEKGAELILQNIAPLSAMRIGGEKSLYIKLKNREEFDKVKGEFSKFKGESKLYVYFEDSETLVCSDSSRYVSISDAFLEFLTSRLGADNVRIK
ncbi:MAG: DNA polymerase III subunit alpha [Clostridia bacterium]|nr:DNA polymerase III subunit alpha [Clostridia bacterium]